MYFLTRKYFMIISESVKILKVSKNICPHYYSYILPAFLLISNLIMVIASWQDNTSTSLPPQFSIISHAVKLCSKEVRLLFGRLCFLEPRMYLINKLAPLGWFVLQRKHVQVCGGGQARFHHSNQRLLGDTGDLRTQRWRRSHLHTSIFAKESFLSWATFLGSSLRKLGIRCLQGHPVLAVCCPSTFWSYLSEYLSDHLTNVLPPLWDVRVQSVQVGAEAQRDDLEVVWVGTQSNRQIKMLWLWRLSSRGTSVGRCRWNIKLPCHKAGLA